MSVSDLLAQIFGQPSVEQQNRHQLSAGKSVLFPREEVLEAMIPTAKNLPLFLTKMGAAAKSTAKRLGNYTDGDDIETLAEAYMKTRYPNRMRVPKKIDYTTSFGPDNGLFFPSTGAIRIKKPMWPNPITLPKMIETLAHETSHALDYSRAAKGTGKLSRSDLAKDLRISNQLINSLDDVAMQFYKALPSESTAFAAGSTARASFHEFLRLLMGKEKGKPVNWSIGTISDAIRK